MIGLRRLLGAALAAAALSASPAARAEAPDRPEGWAVQEGRGVAVVHPPRASQMARRIGGHVPGALAEIEAALGLAPPEEWRRRPVIIYLAPDEAALRELAASRLVPIAPGWAAGWALRGRDVLVLGPGARLGPLVRGVTSVLRHELVHVRLDAALGTRSGEVPSWFQEGVASVLAHEPAWRDVWQLSRSALRGDSPRLEELERGFPSEDADAGPAYIVSYAFVGRLVREEGSRSLGRVVERVAEGESFESAFADVYGRSPAAFEASWRRGFLWRYRWLPILTSGTTLWLMVTLLLLLALWRRRRRSRRILHAWEEEEHERFLQEPYVH